MSYPFELDRSFVELLRANAAEVVIDIDERMSPDYLGPRAAPDALAALAAREWRRITAFEHAAGRAAVPPAGRAAAYASRVLARASTMTPHSFFSWFGIALLAASNVLVEALCALDLGVFRESGAIESRAAEELARGWQRAFSANESLAVSERVDFERLIELDKLDLDHADELESLWRVTLAVASRSPDELEASVAFRARSFDRRARDVEERYVSDSLLDLPLTALVIYGRSRGLRVPLRTPYVAKVE
ncbi:MAG TPA: hypothetical protein VMF11_06540 [Candidatus Baltobacteraceae bacterium]|nr:hypothetical protein [Candidatus Baltobacteraceae bacterium]